MELCVQISFISIFGFQASNTAGDDVTN